MLILRSTHVRFYCRTQTQVRQHAEPSDLHIYTRRVSNQLGDEILNSGFKNWINRQKNRLKLKFLAIW